MDETIDITLQNDYNDKFHAVGVSLEAVLAMWEAVRGIDPELADVLRSAAYSLQPVED